MAHFYASIQGNRGEQTRTGTPHSGITGHIRDWNMGIRVIGSCDTEKASEFKVYLTKGSNQPDNNNLVFIVDKNGIRFNNEHGNPFFQAGLGCLRND